MDSRLVGWHSIRSAIATALHLEKIANTCQCSPDSWLPSTRVISEIPNKVFNFHQISLSLLVLLFIKTRKLGYFERKKADDISSGILYYWGILGSELSFLIYVSHFVFRKRWHPLKKYFLLIVEMLFMSKHVVMLDNRKRGSSCSVE